MPVVQRPRKDQGPSGLEKFLSTVNVLASVGGRVADIIQTGKQQDLTGEQIAQTGEQIEMQRGRDADSAFSRTLAMGLNAGEAGRNANLATLAAQGQAVDPNLALSAIVLGDIADLTLREETRKAVAGLLDRDPTEIGDRFILSPDTLASESQRDISSALEDTRNFRRLTAQSQLGPGGDVAARRGETGILAQVPGAQVGGLTREEALQNQANELLRVAYNEQTGEYELDGAALNNAGPALDMTLQMLGEPGLPKEFDPRQYGLRGPNRIVSGPVFDELTKNALTALWQSDEDARSTVRDSAQLLVEEFQMPFADALALVEGRYNDVDPTLGNDRFYEMMRSWNRGMVELVGGMSPGTQQLITLMTTMAQEMNIPSDQIMEAAEAFGASIRENNPNFVFPENLGALNNILSAVFGGPTGFRLNSGTGGAGPVFQPTPGGDLFGNDLDSPANRADRMGNPVPTAGVEPSPQEVAVRNAFNQYAQLFAAMTPEQRATALNTDVGIHPYTDPTTGETSYLVITRDMLDNLNAQIGGR